MQRGLCLSFWLRREYSLLGPMAICSGLAYLSFSAAGGSPVAHLTLHSFHTIITTGVAPPPPPLAHLVFHNGEGMDMVTGP